MHLREAKLVLLLDTYRQRLHGGAVRIKIKKDVRL